MTLEALLTIVAGVMLRVENGCRNDVLYEGDKNAIRMHAPELLDREIYFIEPITANKIAVHLEIRRNV